ncbi:hypothetical protein VNO78_28447 [Psophocarpus tetragonolobus]|uniref:TPX2 C-terminal domain-containing protein n=1 Tax=Psophocarpus tetragonolobus TaxID=3891 RepID=A0AAN9S1H7_PSOTE
MGESSACLLRSFSTPADTCYDGNPIRGLGESISFGRFMTGELDWGKWSAFTHNRYVEEAEKYSKPGSVAAKKAYFEAHYKRKAAERASASASASALIPEANAQAKGTFESQAQEGNCTDSSFYTSSNVDNVVIAIEQMDKETVNSQAALCSDRHAGQSDINTSDVEEVDLAHPRIDTDLIVQTCTLVDNSNSIQFGHVEDSKNIVASVEMMKRDHGAATASQEVALPVKGRQVHSPKLSTKTVAAKHSRSLGERKAVVAVPPRSGINNDLKGKKSVVDAVEKKRLAAQSLRMSINLPSGTSETLKRQAAASLSRNGLNNFSTSKKSVGVLVDKKRITAPSLYMSINLPSGASITSKTDPAAIKPRNGINFTAKSTKSVRNSVEKRSITSSLRRSINLPSGAGETSKTASVLEQSITKKINSNLPKNNPVALQTSTKAFLGLPNQSSANPPSPGQRTERPLKKSLSGAVTANAKPSSSISFGYLKSSSTTKSSHQSATISTPFRFRSEERAVKRKEFLQRMDETKSKEEEKVKLQRTLKGKTELDHKKLRQSNGSLSKLNERKPGGSQSPSNRNRKISPTIPWSLKLGSKASSSTAQHISLGNSRKPPISTSNSKRTEKINRTRESVTSLSNTTRENASPNIQHCEQEK